MCTNPPSSTAWADIAGRPNGSAAGLFWRPGRGTTYSGAVRYVLGLALTATMATVAAGARADEAEPALALLTGASVLFAGFAVGAGLLSAGTSTDVKTNVGWLTMQTGFALAPLTSHAMAGEWTRGLLFAATPAAALGGTGGIIAVDPSAIDHGGLPEQRALWSLFGVGLLSSAVGVVDSTLCGTRARSVAAVPMVGSGQVGLIVRGTL
jgi:hypothetical protein